MNEIGEILQLFQKHRQTILNPSWATCFYENISETNTIPFLCIKVKKFFFLIQSTLKISLASD